MTVRSGCLRRFAAGLGSLGLVVAIAVAGCPAAVAADEGHRWSPQRPVNRDFRSTDQVSDYEVGVTKDGTAVAVWRASAADKPARLEGARRPSGGEWSRPTVIARIGGLGSFSLKNVVVDDMGNVTVASRDRTHTGDRFRLVVRTWRSDGSVEPATVLARGWKYALHVYGDASGDLVAVVNFREVFSRPFGGSWHKVERLPRGAFAGGDRGDVVLGPGSRVDAVWHEDSIGIRTAALDGDTWGPVTTLAPDRPDHVSDFSAVENSSGDVGVVWRLWTSDYSVDDLVESVFRRAGSEDWDPVVRVNPGPESVDVAVDSPEVDLAADGTMIVAWREIDRDHQYDTFLPILSATRAPTGMWTKPDPIGLTGKFLSLGLSVNADGAASMLTETKDYAAGVRWLAAAQRAAGTETWSTSRFTRKLDPLEGSWFEVDGVLSDGGEVVAVYRKTLESMLRSRTTLIT